MLSLVMNLETKGTWGGGFSFISGALFCGDRSRRRVFYPRCYQMTARLPSLVFSVIKEWAFTKTLWPLITSTTAFHGCVNVSFSLKILKYINSSQSRMQLSSVYEASFGILLQLLIIRWIRGHSNVFCVASLKSDATTQNPQPAGTPCLQETTEKPRPH